MDVEIALNIVKNANKEQFLSTIQLLWKEIGDYELLSKIGEQLAMQELQRQTSPIMDTHNP